MKYLAKLKQIILGLNRDQRNLILSLAISAFATFAAFFIFNLSPWEYVLGLLLFFILTYTILSAFIVIESLFYAGAQISLALFIADMFCKVPNRTEDANDAFLLLAVFAATFILFKFSKRIIENTKKIHTSYLIKEKSQQPYFYWFNMIVFSLTLMALIFSVYRVFSAIAVNLCLAM